MPVPNLKRFINWRATVLAIFIVLVYVILGYKDSGFMSYHRPIFKKFDDPLKNRIDGILNVAPEKDVNAKGTKFSRNETYYHQNEFDPKFYFNPPSSLKENSKVNEERAAQVKKAFQHAWKNYKEFAWGHDNLSPLSKKSSDSLSWGITLVDSLDTLLILGMKEEYAEALKHVEKIDFTKGKGVNFFETTIRYLGGLIAAFDLNGDKILIEKAKVLADKLLAALNTKSGIPSNIVDFETGNIDTFGTTLLAELGSFQLEFTRLSQITNNQVYAEKAQKIIDVMDQMQLKIPGFYPISTDKETGKGTDFSVSFGAMTDSFYEYLLKRYIQTSKREDQYRRMYEKSIDSMHQYLISKLDKERDNLVLLGRIEHNQFSYDMDHLACFAPGMLILGGVNLNRVHDIVVGLDLTYTCYQFYQNTKTKLSAEVYNWYPTKEEFEKQAKHWAFEPLKKNYDLYKTPLLNRTKALNIQNPKYILRPETIESIFYAFRLTGNPIYQDWGWDIFQAIEKHCKVANGYAEVVDVNTENVTHTDSMESFFLAETLKYLYLLFSPPDVINLNKYVFTTEAHPIKIVK